MQTQRKPVASCEVTMLATAPSQNTTENLEAHSNTCFLQAFCPSSVHCQKDLWGICWTTLKNLGPPNKWERQETLPPTDGSLGRTRLVEERKTAKGEESKPNYQNLLEVWNHLYDNFICDKCEFVLLGLRICWECCDDHILHKFMNYF